MLKLLSYKSLYSFGMDFSNLSKPIISQGIKNFTIPHSNPIDGYLTNNKQKKHVVIMIHQWWGFNASMTKTADLFSNQNITVFVPDLYRGKPAVDAQEAGHKMNGLNWPYALDDIRNIKDYFKKDYQDVSIVGFCMGGALAFASVASIQGFKSAGIFYGIPDLNIFRLDKITANVIAHFGKLDPLKGFSDAESAQKLSKDSQINKYPIKVKIWQNVAHAFCNQDSKYFDQKTRNQAFKLTRQIIQA